MDKHQALVAREIVSVSVLENGFTRHRFKNGRIFLTDTETSEPSSGKTWKQIAKIAGKKLNPEEEKARSETREGVFCFIVIGFIVLAVILAFIPPTREVMQRVLNNTIIWGSYIFGGFILLSLLWVAGYSIVKGSPRVRRNAIVGLLWLMVFGIVRIGIQPAIWVNYGLLVGIIAGGIIAPQWMGLSVGKEWSKEMDIAGDLPGFARFLVLGATILIAILLFIVGVTDNYLGTPIY